MPRSMTSISALCCLSVAVTVVACGLRPSAQGPDGGPGGTSSLELLCSRSNPCPSGQFCFNGLCAVGCNGDGDCAASQYCDTSEFGDRLCHDREVKTCPATPCASDQSCTDGLCSTPVPSAGADAGSTPACNPDGVTTGKDGCDRSSLCFQPDAQTAPSCFQYPACPQSGPCPVGPSGALCNDNLVPNKARICLPNLCKRTIQSAPDSPNCPSSWHCILMGSPNDTAGVCSNGANLMPCDTGSDCTSGRCVKLTSGSYSGICSDGGPGSFCATDTDCKSGMCNIAPGFAGTCG